MQCISYAIIMINNILLIMFHGTNKSNSSNARINSSIATFIRSEGSSFVLVAIFSEAAIF